MRPQPRQLLALSLASGLGLAAATIGAQDGSWPASAAALAAIGLTAWRPDLAVLIVSALVALGEAVGIATGVPAPWTELLLMTAAAGWLARRAGARTPPSDPAFDACALAFGVAAVGSALALWWAGIWAAIPPPMGVADWARALALEIDRGGSPLRLALRLAVGAATAAWIAAAARDAELNRRAGRLLLVGVTALAVVSVYRVVEIALRSETPLARAVEVVGAARIAPIIGDHNALGALFLMITPLAFHLCLTRGQRLLGAATLPLLLAGAWLAGSRTTMAVTPVALLAVLLLRRPAIVQRRWRAGSLVLIAMAAGLAAFTETGRHTTRSAAWTIRRDFATVTVRMLRDDPLFGVGMGQYHQRSAEYMPPTLQEHYERENAHNQFFQVAGELGLLGLVPFAGLLALAGIPALVRVRRNPPSTGLTVGVVAFVAAWTAQHPLLDTAVAGAFWVALGLLKAGAGPGPVLAGSRSGAVGAAAAAVLLVLLPVQALRRVAATDLAGVVRGPEQALRHPPGSGGPPKWQMTLYLPGTSRRCVVSLQGRTQRDTLVTLLHNHRDAGAVIVPPRGWTEYVLLAPSPPRWPVRHDRLDLSWDATAHRDAIGVGASVCDTGEAAGQ